MKRKKLKIRKVLESLKKNAAMIPRSEDNMEVIHQFRIAYKKMRAILRLCHTKHAKKTIKIPAALRDIYNKAGKVRKFQLYYSSVLPHLNKRNRYLFELMKSIQPLTQQLDKVVSKVDFPKAIKSITRRAPQSVSNKMVRKFIRRKTEAVRSVLAQTVISDRKLHSVKKDLKDILYNVNLFSFALPKRLKAVGITDEKGLKEFTDLLNDHQDYVDGINILRSSSFSNLTDKNKAALHNILAQWEERKKLLAQRIQNRKIILLQTQNALP